MLLQGERVTIRDMEANDADFMLALLNTKGFIENIGDRQMRNNQQALEKIQTAYTIDYPDYGLFTVVDNNTNTQLGTVSYLKRDHLSHDDIGYAFLPQHCGKGLAYEATKLLLDHKLKNGKTCVIAVVNPTNTGSIKLLHKLNFKYVGETIMDDETIPISKYKLTVE